MSCMCAVSKKLIVMIILIKAQLIIRRLIREIQLFGTSTLEEEFFRGIVVKLELRLEPEIVEGSISVSIRFLKQ